ncbi:S-layer homology domain-containing protein [Planococcus salinus]|uniref:S-layer protein n=1 Tax=Planococcus salinus TaxID=1848460 RepID=A0A3M8P8L5_9BACL|nr:S-layer homology domain-containing protein [Planococcus salinus]RNF39988.1 S-layer protein [Planococcus salinus]
MKKTFVAALAALLLAVPATAYADHFPDVSSKHWAYESIHSLSAAEIVNGYSTGFFRPDREVTRAQAAVILARALEVDTATTFQPDFQDIDPDYYAYPAVAALTEQGVFSNTGKFNPGQPLPRSQMAKIIVEGFDIVVDSNHQLAFRDVPSTLWAHDYIITLAEVGISEGYTPTTFRYGVNVTRGQLAAFIDRALQFERAVEEGTISYDATQQLYQGVNSTGSVAHETIPLVNQERANANLTALEEDPELTRIAQLKAEDMAENDYFEHTSPTYGEPWEMAVALGYPTNQVGENIAGGYKSPGETVAAWMDSQGHRENILRASYTHIGVGYAEDQDGFPYWVHMFSIR